MARTISDAREFLTTAARGDILEVVVKKNAGNTKFKLRGAHELYTYTVSDSERAAKILSALPPKLKVTSL